MIMEDFEREILDQLIEAGKITEEDISKIMTPAKRELVEIVHMLMCNEDHDVGDPNRDRREETGCQWYIEEQMDNTWKRDAHLKGTGRVNDILRRFNLTIGEALRSLDIIKEIIGDAEAGGYKGLLRFVLSSNSAKFVPESTTKDSTSSSDDSSLSG